MLAGWVLMRQATEKEMEMFTLELTGFVNFKRIKCSTIEEARVIWAKAQKEQKLTVYSNGKVQHNGQWSSWELYQNEQLIKEGTF